MRVRVPTRDAGKAGELKTLPTLELCQADVHDPQQLRDAIAGADAVINLVGVLHDAPGRRGFRGAHVELARTVAGACRATGVQRLLHMSALNAAPEGPSVYLQTKGEAEAIVRASGLAYTIFRPSVIFGPEDKFLNVFADMLRIVPVVVLACPDARFQPIYVEDLTHAFARALDEPGAIGETWNFCGPRIYTLRELVQYVGTVIGCRRPVIGLGDRLSYLQALAMEWLPVKLMTRDNYYSMQIDSVCADPLPLGIVPTALEAVAPGWLQHGPTRYDNMRARHGR